MQGYLPVFVQNIANRICHLKSFPLPSCHLQVKFKQFKCNKFCSKLQFANAVSSRATELTHPVTQDRQIYSFLFCNLIGLSEKYSPEVLPNLASWLDEVLQDD